MKHVYKIICCLYLVSGFSPPPVSAWFWVNDSSRELEERRLRQLHTVQSGVHVAPFVTDGCSGGQSQLWALLVRRLPGVTTMYGDKPPWEACCVKHDKAYWRGSAVDGYTQREHADDVFRQCIVATGFELAPQLSTQLRLSEEDIRQAFQSTAERMYRTVRLDGMPCSSLAWRWGYGWPNCAFASTSLISEIYSNVKADEHITFFTTAAWLDEEKGLWQIPLHAWIYEPEDSVVRKEVFAEVLEYEYDLTAAPNTEENFRQRTNLLIADNERGKKLIIHIAGRDVELPESRPNGHTETTLKLPIEVVNAFSDQGRLHFLAVLQAKDQRRFEGTVQLVPRDGISIISDIDDTIKISHVTDLKQLFDHTFFKDYQAVAGMPELYQQLAAHGAILHFVSSSPWQLYSPLQEFLHQTGFPLATLSLKEVRFRDKTLLNLFKKGTETKPQQIEPILERYPQRHFILFGDNGEEDPEVYGDIARRYSAQIQRILIRNVDNSSREAERYKKAFENIPQRKWQLFDEPGQIILDELLDGENSLSYH